jgi:epoxyqueuosine reductase QueG
MPRAELETPDVASFSTLTDAEFKARFGDTPLMRAKLPGLKRNASAVATSGQSHERGFRATT